MDKSGTDDRQNYPDPVSLTDVSGPTLRPALAIHSNPDDSSAAFIASRDPRRFPVGNLVSVRMVSAAPLRIISTG
jgi:hypothetical protein